MENYYRKKLLNAILYFAKNVRHANETKIFKLLNFFDFEHFRQTGYPAIGLEYYTFEWGPVPKEFWEKIKDGNVPDDFKKDLAIIKRQLDETNPEKLELLFRAISNPDLSIFSAREIDIIEKLSFIYKDSTASEMSLISHEEEKPWSITMAKKGKYQKIDYLLSIMDTSPISEDIAIEQLKEYFEMLNNFNINPV